MIMTVNKISRVIVVLYYALAIIRVVSVQKTNVACHNISFALHMMLYSIAFTTSKRNPAQLTPRRIREQKGISNNDYSA